MERQITEEQFEKVRIHMRDNYDVAEHEWDKEELIEAIYELLVSKNESLHLVSSSLLNKRIDKWIDENDKNAGMCDGISSVIFTSYSQAYWNVKQFIEVNEI